MGEDKFNPPFVPNTTGEKTSEFRLLPNTKSKENSHTYERTNMKMHILEKSFFVLKLENVTACAVIQDLKKDPFPIY